MKGLLHRGHRFGVKQFKAGLTTAVMLALAATSGPSAAQDDGTLEAQGGIGGSMFRDLPPTFLDNSIAANTADMTSCFLGTLTSAASAIATTGMSSGGGLNTIGQGLAGSWSGATCAEPGDINKNPSCSDVREGNRFSPGRLQALRRQYESARDALACQKGKMASIQNELSCLQRQASTLSSQIASMQNAYSQNINAMKDYIGRLHDHTEGTRTQLVDVDRFLNGDGQSGRQGLLGLEQEVEAALNQEIPDRIQAVEESFRAIREQERALEEMVQSRTAGLTQQCFTTRTQSNYLCGKHDNPATPDVRENAPTNAKAYLLCRYEQEALRTSTGSVDLENASRQREAAERRAQLEALLNQILGDTPNQTTLPTVTTPEQTAAASQQFANQPINLLSIADLESQYGGQLRALSGNGVDVYGFVMGAMGSCFRRAEQQVRRERRRESSQLGQNQAGLKRARRAAHNEANKALNDFSQRYGRVVRALSGMNIPLDVGNCRNARPETKINCLREVETEFRGLLNGTGDNSAFTLSVRGDDSVAGFPVACSGLKGCIARMQVVKQNLDERIQFLERKKTMEVRAFNVAVENTTSQIAAQLSPQSQQLDARLQQMNAMLASLGITPGVEISRVSACQLESETDEALGGLVKAPTDMMCLVGGRMTPPMLDFAADNFATALSGIAEKSRETDTKLGDVAAGMRVLETLANSCGQEELDREMQEFRRLVTQWNSSNCNYSRAHCDPNSSNSSLHSLQDTVSHLDGGDSVSGGDEIYALNSGIRNMCNGFEEGVQAEARRTARRESDRNIAHIRSVKEQLDGLHSTYGDQATAAAAIPAPSPMPSPAPTCSVTSVSPATYTIPADSVPDASVIESSCRPSGEEPPETYECRSLRSRYYGYMRNCVHTARMALGSRISAIQSEIASAESDSGGTGERRAPNAGTCSGLVDDLEGRAARINDIRRRMNEGSGAGGAL